MGDKKAKPGHRGSITKRGASKRMPAPFYPKRYTVEVALNEDRTGCVIKRTAENFAAWELYGLLKLLTTEIEDQMRFKPEEQLKVD